MVDVFGRVYLNIPADIAWETASHSPQLYGWLHCSPIVVTQKSVITPKLLKIFAQKLTEHRIH